MSIEFIKPSTVIKRLLLARTKVTLTKENFKIWGAGEFEKARQSSFFAKTSGGDRLPVLIVTVGNNSGSAIHNQGSGESNLAHTIDVHFIAPLYDRRGQFRDEESVWFKQFLFRALHAFNPSSGANPLLYSGDNLTEIAGVAGYSRTFSFTQNLIAGECDTWGGDEDEIRTFDDLDEFLKLYTETFVDAPPLGDISEESELDLDLRE